MNIGDLLRRLSLDLNDAAPGYEFATWSQEQLRGYIEEGLQLVASSQPATLTQELVLELTPGAVYQSLCDCLSLTRESIIGQSTSEGEVFQTLRPRPDTDNAWPGKECPVKSKPFRLREFSIATDGNAFRVYPSVPKNEKVYLAVRCPVVPDVDDDTAEVPQDAVLPVIQWALYRAKIVDAAQSQVMSTMAVEHRDTCYSLLGVKVPTKRGRNATV
jgi:hypothetical protein